MARGHAAVSCDLVPSASPGPHIIGDAATVVQQGWDLVIGHPPCTYLANSGVRWLKSEGSIDRPRLEKLIEGAAFFRRMLTANARHVAVENPIIHRWAKELCGVGRPDQVIQPWQFGHGETKATCLWLRNLPPLRATNIVAGREARVHRMPPSPDRAAKRSETYKGIAEAMAAQWGCYCERY